MLRPGERIAIKPSKQLENAGCKSLVNKTGVITRVVSNGVYADVKILRRVRNYFIPMKSVESSEEVNKARVHSLLKATVL